MDVWLFGRAFPIRALPAEWFLLWAFDGKIDLRPEAFEWPDCSSTNMPEFCMAGDILFLMGS